MNDESSPHALSAEVVDGTFDLARGGRIDELTQMIRAGVPVDTINARSDSMLIVASYAQQSEAVAALIELGADVNVENRMGQTAISCAVFRSDEKILRQLLDAGANPALGFHSAGQIAEQFNLTAMSAVLAEYEAR